MRFPVAPETYSAQDQTEVRRIVESEDRNTHKRGQDVEIGDGRLILKRASDGIRHSITVDSSGNVIATAV